MEKLRRWWIGAFVVMIAFASVTVSRGEYASAAPGDNRAGLAGEGSAIRPYRIDNAEQLYAFSLHQDDYLNAHLELVADIDFTGWDWDSQPRQPVGTSASPFTGTFDGNGYAIRGLVIHLDEQNRVGMFGDVGSGGLIQRLSLIDANVKGFWYVGALAGRSEGTIRNVSVTGIVYGTGQLIGGAIGRSSGYVSDAHADVDVTGGLFDVGGLIGASFNGILASSANGNVRGRLRVGGLVGSSANHPIRFSYATGDVSGSISVGGLIGQGSGDIEFSYATGNISGIDEVGGLVGSANNKDAIVRHSYASGNVEGENVEGENIEVRQTIGGLVGKNSSTVQHSYAYGAVTSKIADPDTEIGGIAGANYWKVEFSYWNRDANPDIISGVGEHRGDGSEANLYGLTEEEFLEKNNFDGVLQSQVWTFDDGILPKLKPAVVDVNWINRIDAKTGTAFADLPLPATVGVRLTDGSRETLPVNWSTGDYKNAEGVYHVEGTLDPAPADQISAHSPDKVTVKVVVRNDADDKPVLVIHTREQLYSLSSHQVALDAYYVLAADIDFTGWDWDTHPWQPIGTDYNPFSGTFDGNGHAIRGLVVNMPGRASVGMFEKIDSEGAVQRLKLVDANVKGHDFVGALAGRNEGTIRNVSVTGMVYGTDGRTGGVIGNSRGNVSDTHADVDVTGTRFTGGLIGYSIGNIVASSARGNVRGTTEVGGLVGTLTDSTILYSYASGDVFGSGDAIGGLVGESYRISHVEYSYATGNVSGNSYVGGLIGNNENQDANVLNNYASGNVEGADQVGGVVGRNNGTVQYSYAYGKVQAKNSGCGNWRYCGR